MAESVCNICDTSTSTRFFKRGNRKYKENIIPKLETLLGLQDLNIKEICWCCNNKIQSAYSFVSSAKEKFCRNSTTTTTTRDSNKGTEHCDGLAVIAPTPPTTIAATINDAVPQSGIDHTYCEPSFAGSQKRDLKFPEEVKNLSTTETEIIKKIDNVCSELSSGSKESSILGLMRPMTALAEDSEMTITKIINEISTRMPFVYQLMLRIAGIDHSKQKNSTALSSVAAAYALLIYQRNNKLSAFQRLTSAICLEGHLSDEGFSRLNKLGITQSARSKLCIQDECKAVNHQRIVQEIKKNPLVKIIGDNLDVYIRTAHERQSKGNTDLHLFSSSLIFPRIATPNLDNKQPVINLQEIQPEMITLHGHYRSILRNAYFVLIGKLLVELPAFDWLRTVVPAIHFPYERHMNKKSTVFSLPIQHKNENKLEDCCDILDEYEDYLHRAFVDAFGETNSALEKFKVVVGGDQLTRVRLQEAKNLRNIAVNTRKRYDDLNPVVVEMWHNKQDLLEKAYKRLYSLKSARQPGTLYHAKAVLQRGSVNGKVKSRYKAHHELFMTVGKALLKDCLMEFLGMESEDSIPVHILNEEELKRGKKWMEKEEKCRILDGIIRKFIDNYHYTDFDPYLGSAVSSTDDELYNYCSNYLYWYLHFLEMDDTAKAGDITRLIPNCMNSIPFFFSHSRLSKYFVENIDFILKCEFLLSPLQKLRVQEGAFVNLRGGSGNNMEADLMQENSVRIMKNLIKQLGANKTKSAIDRTTAAAETINSINDGLDKYMSSRKHNSKHHISNSLEDERTLSKLFRRVRPFQIQPGRKCTGFGGITVSPFSSIDLHDFRDRISQVIRRLHYGQVKIVDEEMDEEAENSEEE